MEQHNFLVIGLGGTGCAVVRELKKKLYTEWRSQGSSGVYPEVYSFEGAFGGQKVESRIATLSVDSNEKDLAGQGERDRKWRVFGETLRLGDREKVLIDPSGITKILGSIERYPGIEPWIRDDIPFVRDINVGSTKAEGCNQIRRMGRIALATGDSRNNFIERVEDRIKELRASGQIKIEIHIACTMAAGTGSGSVIDALAQIQHFQKTSGYDFPIYVHGFFTARSVGSKDVGNFYANQYAALIELNAFRMATYKPWNTGATRQPERLNVPDPTQEGLGAGDIAGTFKSVAMITDTTEGNFDVPFETQIDNVAELLFQLSVRQVGNAPKELRDALSNEDRAQDPADVSGGDRSTSFISYGVQRAAIPEREIREKLSYSFGRQFILRVLYNNWDGHFRNSPRTFSKDGFVDARCGVWRVTREHLCLDLVEDATGQPKYDTYEIEWRKEMTRQAERVIEVGDAYEARVAWVGDLDRRAENYWDKGFRGRAHAGGAVDFFKNRKEPAEIRARARAVRDIIERDLIRGFEGRDPDYPLHHIPDAIDFLIKQRIENDRLAFGELESKAVEQAKEADAQRAEIREQYQRAGRWAKGKHQRLFGNYRDATMRLYYWRAMQLAADYAREFCAALIDELLLLQRHVGGFATRLKLINTNFDQEIAARISETEEAGKGGDIYLVNAKAINNTIRERFEDDKAMQDKQVNVTMEALQQLRGDRFEFTAYLEKMPVDNTERVAGPFVDELRRVAESTAVEADRRLRESDPQFAGIFGQNIVRKLYFDHGGRVDGELEDWLRSLMDRSMPMVAFDPSEEPMDLPKPGPVLRRCVFVPKCKSVPDEFEQQLANKIKSIVGGQGSCKTVESHFFEVPEDRNPSELVIISVAFFFSARYTKVAHGLKDKYLERLEQKTEVDSRRAYFQVHTESHNPPLPDLMKLGRREVLDKNMAPVLLATALDLMRIEEATGQVRFGNVDSFGRIKDKVDTGMRVKKETIDATAQSETRFGQSIPLEMVVLFTLYLEEFREDSLNTLNRLVENHFAADVDLAGIQQRLETMSGQAFLLSGKKEDDPNYALINNQTKLAVELARRLADRSSLTR
uniref:Tubulin like n=1 Tax=Candidatus Kentrum sp. LFY TaxID=2126342 RepID=A0A450V4F2_9GAMM|nr:MAG: Tubulin like [Candidatus Kentron sp. LFY]